MSVSDLRVVGLEAVKVAFRAGACANNVGNAEEQSQGTQGSWSTFVTDIPIQTAETCLRDFHAETQLCESSQLYISYFGLSSVTISGPPSTVKCILEASQELRSRSTAQLPVFAPYHANHLFRQEDVGNIVDDGMRTVLDSFQSTGTIYSTVTGNRHESKSTADLFRILLNEILCEPIHWNKLLASIALEASAAESACEVQAIGSNTFLGKLISSFGSAGIPHTVLEFSPSTPNTRSPAISQAQNNKIAVVGMAGRFPNAANHDELWELLSQGLDVHREIPKERFDPRVHYDASGKGKNKSHTLHGCFIDEPALFDPRFFNMSPREAARTDPMARLALVTAYEALEMSGFTPNRTSSTNLSRVGTFYGQASDDWREVNAAEDIDTYFITGGVRAFAAGRINYHFKFGGPSYSIDTACSSSLAAIQLACTSLLASECDTACAGGSNVLTNPDFFAGLSKGQFLSRTGPCKTFDNDADGYCRGDGCGTLVLKRYAEAIADNDNVLGCILASSTNHSAEAVSITHPHAGSQESLYKKILAESDLTPDDVSYCELHGTGTQAGDHTEMESITNVFASAKSPRKEDNPLFIGSLKPNIGHGEAASGLSAVVKSLLILREDTIPPNVGIKSTINRTFPRDLKARNVHIPIESVHWPRNKIAKRRILVNNFSAAGGNTAILLEEAQIPSTPAKTDPRSVHIIAVSARSVRSLEGNVTNLIQYIDKHPQVDLPSFSYTLTARRIQHNYRIAVSSTNLSGARAALLARTRDQYRPVSSIPTETVFVFTGQGVQYAGLGKSLYTDLASFRHSIDRLDRSSRMQGFPSFLPLITDADIVSLSPVVVQIGLACIQVSLARMWEAWGVKPKAVIGHSLGEYPALHVAGVISANAMIRLVGHRAQLLVSHCTRSTHGMLAVNAEAEAIRAFLGSDMLEVACKNGPSATVLCGTVDSLDSAVRNLARSGWKSRRLNVDFAFHSTQVDPFLEEFKRFANSVSFHEPRIPVLSPVIGEVVTTAGHFGGEYLTRHARETVDFTAALEAASSLAIVGEKTVWLEIGAQPVCSEMIKRTLRYEPRTFASLKKSESAWQTISSNICGLWEAGVTMNFHEYHSSFEGCHRLLTLPAYAFDNKRYWLDYHNNWCLTKGEAPAPQKLDSSSRLSTATCQELISEEFDHHTGKVVVRSNLAESELAALISGHLVNGAALVPSSIYADMALTIARYMQQRLRPADSQIGMNVCEMEVSKPLILERPPKQRGQHIQVEATADLRVGKVCLKYRSVSPQGKLVLDHGSCLVKFESVGNWLDSWQTIHYMVQTQIDLLKQKLEKGEAHKVLRGLAYKLFSALVTYDSKYQGMQEVTLDGEEMEASALISFQAHETSGTFFCSPYWIDSLCHISGFVVNATDLTDSATNVYISHGWRTMRFARPIFSHKQYRTYVRMQPQSNNTRSGDVYIFEGSEIIGKVGGIKFQQIPRRILETLLPRTALGLGCPPETPRKVFSYVEIPKNKIKHAPISEPSRPLLSKVLDIVADETGVERAELSDGTDFKQLGIDSLMLLSMATRFQAELGFEIRTSIFTDLSTIGEMKRFFRKYDTKYDSTGIPFIAENSFSRTSESLSDGSLAATPKSSLNLENSSRDVSVVDGYSRTDTIRQIIAQEMGLETADLADDADLASMGMDSLMSLTILAAVQESCGLALSSSFLLENPTINDIELALGFRNMHSPSLASSKGLIMPNASMEDFLPAQKSSNDTNLMAEKTRRDLSQYPAATSILLQGDPKTATKILFLLPDGSGSATSYMRLPRLDASLAIYALNCPFLKAPHNFAIGITPVCTLYLHEIRRHQPHGPYHLGGWSAGGVLAYEITLQLLAFGEVVSTLFLIDSPCPIELKPLPARLFAYFDELGLLGNRGTGSSPPWLIPHFESSVKNLAKYEPRPVPKGTALRAMAIWAREGLCEDGSIPMFEWAPEEEDEPRTIEWLLKRRKEPVGDGGWGQLLGDGIDVQVVDGNHFTMMGATHVSCASGVVI